MKIWISEKFTSKNGSLKLYQFEVEISKQIFELKIDISNKISIDSSNFNLYLNDILLNNKTSIESCQISENSILQIHLLDVYPLRSIDDQYLIIIIKYLQNETNEIKIEKHHVRSNFTIKELFYMLKSGKKIHNLKSFLHKNKILENDKTLKENEIEDYDEIKLVDNLVLVNYENYLYDNQVIRKLDLESAELNDNLIKLCQVWNIDSNFISVIYQGNIVKVIPNGNYLSFISDGNDIDDSCMVFVTENLSINRVIHKYGIVLNKSDLISSAIVKIKKSINIANLDEIKIRFNGKILDMDKRLIDYGIANFSELVLVCKIIIKMFNSDENQPVWVCLRDNVSQLKSLLLTSEINQESFDLYFLGEKMSDDNVLSIYGVEINSILTLIYSIESTSIINLILIDYEILDFIPDSIKIIDLQSEHVSENRNILSRNINTNRNLTRIFYQEEIVKSVNNGKYFYFVQNNDMDENLMIILAEEFNENRQLKRRPILFSKAQSVELLIEHIKHLLNIPNLKNIKIQFGEIVLENSKILSEYQIKNGSELRLLRSVSVKQFDSDKIEIYWIFLEDSFLKLKEMISSKLEININQIYLYYFGELISDEELIVKYEADIDDNVITIVISKDKINSIQQCILINYQNCIFNSNRFHQIDFQFENGYENRKYLSEITQIDLNLISIIYNEQKVKNIPIGNYLYGILNDDDTNDSIIIYVEESVSEIEKITKHAILLNKNDSVDSVKEKIINDLKIKCNEFEIRFNGIILNSNSTLLDYEINSGLTINMLFKIIVTKLSSNDSYPFWMFSSDSITGLKQLISTNLSVNVNQMNLFFFGKLLLDEETLCENRILTNSELIMSEEILSISYVTLVDYKQCYLSKYSDIDSFKIHEIDINSENVNENRNKLSLAIKKSNHLINVFHNEEIINVIPNGKYLYFIQDGNYCKEYIIVYVKESISTSGELNTLAIVIKKTDSVSNVLEKIQKTVDREEELKIRFNENTLENDKMVSDYNIKNGSELILLIQIIIKDLKVTQNFLFFISLLDKVEYIKKLISSKINVKEEQINLSFDSNNLKNEKLCSFYKIDSGSTIIMIASIKGGIIT